MSKPSVAAIVVTHNRISLLKENLAALRAQTYRLDEIIIVNNGSTDGTADWLAAQSDLTVISQSDVGVGGGQCEGIKTAYAHKHDWFWSMDDDLIPNPDALEKLLNCPMAQDERTGFLCSFVRWMDGSLCFSGAPNVHPDYPSLIKLLPQGVLRLNSGTFLSLLVHRRAVAKKGLPLREMFVWFGDEEFTCRIAEDFFGYQVLASEVEHRSRTNRWFDFKKLAELPVDYLEDGLRNFVFLRERAAPRFCGKLWRLKSALRLQLLVWRQFSGADWRKLSRAIWRGLFFNPKIEMPE